MSVTVAITADQISPRLAYVAAIGQGMTPVIEAMAEQFRSRTVRAHNDSALRAAAWPPKKDGTASRLRERGRLAQSWKTTVHMLFATVSSDAPYAAVHQFGSRKKTGRGGGIPARPIMPLRGTVLTPEIVRLMRKVADAKIDRILAGGK